MLAATARDPLPATVPEPLLLFKIIQGPFGSQISYCSAVVEIGSAETRPMDIGVLIL